MLDRAARNELLTLSKTNGATVARHLVMAGMLLESDPELAHQHALAAVRGAGRIAVAREALALTSYATGRYVEALKEVRAARRLSGRDEHHVLEADSERGLGRPDRALQVVERAQANAATDAEFAELAIVASGARADLGENEAGLLLLRTSRLEKIRDVAIRVRLDQVIADRLDEIGRAEEAAQLRASLPVVLDEADEPFEVIDLVEDDEDEQSGERSAEHVDRPAPEETAEAVPGPDDDAPTEQSDPTADAELAEEPEAEADMDPEPEPEPEPGTEPEADIEPDPEPEDDGHEQLDLFSSLGDPSDEGPASGSTVDR
jgi:tetratricopeptide (TPR) repeat protein